MKPSGPCFLGTAVIMHDRLVTFPFFVTGGQKENPVNRFSILRTLPAQFLRTAEFPIFDLGVHVCEDAVLTVYTDVDFVGMLHGLSQKRQPLPILAQSERLGRPLLAHSRERT